MNLEIFVGMKGLRQGAKAWSLVLD